MRKKLFLLLMVCMLCFGVTACDDEYLEESDYSTESSSDFELEIKH